MSEIKMIKDSYEQLEDMDEFLETYNQPRLNMKK